MLIKVKNWVEVSFKVDEKFMLDVAGFNEHNDFG